MRLSQRTRRSADELADARLLALVILVIGGGLAVGASIQTVFVLGPFSLVYRTVGPLPALELVWRVVVNFGAVLGMLVGVWAVQLVRRPPLLWLPLGLALAVVGGLTRGALQWWSGINRTWLPWLADAAAAAVMAIIVLGFAYAAVAGQRRIRDAERRRADQAAVAAKALAALQSEELRVRRQIAESLHSGVQGRFVLLGVQLGAIADDAPPSLRARLDAVRAELDDIRENEVRTLSAALYPESLEHGAVPALRALLARIPPVIAVHVDIDDEAERLEGGGPGALTETARLLVVRSAEEAVTNALRHGGATRLAVSLRAREKTVELRVEDDGTGLAPGAEPSGLRRLDDRLRDIGGALEVTSGQGGGTVLAARVPLRADRVA